MRPILTLTILNPNNMYFLVNSLDPDQLVSLEYSLEGILLGVTESSHDYLQKCFHDEITRYNV